MIILDGVPVANPQRNQRFIIYTTSQQGVEQVWVAIVVRTNKHTTITKSSVTISLQEADRKGLNPINNQHQPKYAVLTEESPLCTGCQLYYSSIVPDSKVILGTITNVSFAPPI
jgi:hypothetical protein